MNLLIVFLASSAAAAEGPAPEKERPRILRGADGRPVFLCGPGDPEDFLYRGGRNADGIRRGDQMAIIEKLGKTGANCLYIEAIRSHGGDGDRTHNPFIDSDPAKGLDRRILDQWEEWFRAMDERGIVIFFIIYDDSATIWKTGDEVGPEEARFIAELVGSFRRHSLLTWCVAEEYQEAFSAARVRAIAREIRKADPRHPIAAHKLHGLDFAELADCPDFDQFAIQYNVKTAAELHDGVVKAFRDSGGRYSLNLAEAADYGSGETARKKSWAIAMGGAQVMVLGMDVAGTPVADLEDCGRLARFMELADWPRLAPHDELRLGGAEHVLARPPGRYVAYASALAGEMGLQGLAAGRYRLRWLDCASGAARDERGVAVSSGDRTFPAPAGLGREIALLIEREPD